MIFGEEAKGRQLRKNTIMQLKQFTACEKDSLFAEKNLSELPDVAKTKRKSSSDLLTQIIKVAKWPKNTVNCVIGSACIQPCMLGEEVGNSAHSRLNRSGVSIPLDLASPSVMTNGWSKPNPEAEQVVGILSRLLRGQPAIRTTLQSTVHSLVLFCSGSFHLASADRVLAFCWAQLWHLRVPVDKIFVVPVCTFFLN